MSDMTALNDRLGQLIALAEARAKDGAREFDRAAMTADIVAALNARDEALIEQRSLDARRPVPGAGIPADGAALMTTGNRYAGAVRDIARDGFTRRLGKAVTAADMVIAHAMINHQMKAWSPTFGTAPVAPSTDLAAAVKALTSTTSGAGAELVPTGLATSLWADFFLASRVAGAFVPVDMPTNPFDVPTGLGDVTWRKGTQNIGTVSSDPATGKSTLTATELMTEQNWSYTLTEDSAIALAPAIRARLALSGAEIIDGFLLNADSTNAATGNINSDDALPNANDYYLSDGQDGLRHLWLVDNTGQGASAGAALTDAHIVAALGRMGKYAVVPDQLVMLMDIATYLTGMLATGTGAPGEYLATLDKVGAQALVLTGQIGSYRGIPVVISASYARAAADGKVDAATPGNNTKGSLTIAHRAMWYVGFMRDLLIEMDRDIQRRQYVMVSSIRQAVAAFGTRSTAKHTAGIYNIT